MQMPLNSQRCASVLVIAKTGMGSDARSRVVGFPESPDGRGSRVQARAERQVLQRAMPQLAAAQQATNLSTETQQPQAAAPVTPSAGGFDSGVLDLSKGPNCKTSSPNSPDSGTTNLANIPYDARERTKAEKSGDAITKQDQFL